SRRKETNQPTVTNEHQCMRADPAFQKLCEEKQPSTSASFSITARRSRHKSSSTAVREREGKHQKGQSLLFGQIPTLELRNSARSLQTAIPVTEKSRQSWILFLASSPVSDYDKDCRVLEIEPGASLEEVRQAYLDQTKIWHPDRFSNDIRLQKKAEEKLKQINLAYQRLCGGGPYEPPVLNPSPERSPSEWIAVFVALRRAVRKSVIAITRPFALLIEKTVNESNKLFQWCCRQRRSIGVATTAFVLGFASGVWFLPHKSEIWAKISGLRQKIIEKSHRMAQVPVAKPSPTTRTVL